MRWVVVLFVLYMTLLVGVCIYGLYKGAVDPTHQYADRVQRTT